MDIETYSFYDNGIKKSIMYIWSVSLNGLCFFGRTWEQYQDLIVRLHNILCLEELNLNLIIYIHNLGYEFQFMRNWFTWDSVFARSARKPIKAVCGNVIYKCSYLLSGYSLATVAKNLHNHVITKLKGDLDYTIPRNSKTILTNEELKYCYNDIKIVEYYIAEEIERNGDITKIPLTQTGYVRKLVKSYCYPKNKDEYKKFKDLIKNLTIELEEYKLLKKAYAGGFTHANNLYVGDILKNVSSIDFASSYPAVMIAEKFPMSKGEKITIKNKEEFEYNLKTYCCIFEITLYNVKPLVDFEHILSESKCYNIIGQVVDNGRIVIAERLTTCITEIDFISLQKFYSFSYSIGTFYRYVKNYLPKPFINAILDLYKDKTELKGVDGKEIEYMHAKQLINSLYGMTVTDISPKPIVYDNNIGWYLDNHDIQDDLLKYNAQKQRFLFYPWGIYVTAYARRNLFTGILEFGEDYIYSDTDSIKAINYNKHLQYVNNYNNTVILKNKKTMDYYNFPVNSCSLRDKKGVLHDLGVWDFEGTFARFKTLGAKRYLYEKGSDKSFASVTLFLTVAGVNKSSGVEYLKTKKEPFLEFTDKMVFPSDYSGRLTLTYCDNEISGELKDIYGNIAEYHEKSYIHMEPSDYNMSLSEQFIKYLNSIRQLIEYKERNN